MEEWRWGSNNLFFFLLFFSLISSWICTDPSKIIRCSAILFLCQIWLSFFWLLFFFVFFNLNFLFNFILQHWVYIFLGFMIFFHWSNSNLMTQITSFKGQSRLTLIIFLGLFFYTYFTFQFHFFTTRFVENQASRFFSLSF